MMFRGIFYSLLVAGLVVSCKKVPEEVTVSQKRELTAWDHGTNPLVAVMPPEWRRVPGTQMRLKNYRFGPEDASGEVYLSEARGGVLPNVNRWLGQFGKPPLANTDALETIEVLGKQGVLVQAEGKFGGAMGKGGIEDAALLGVIVDLKNEGLLSVKMIGPKDLVLAEKQRLMDYCRSLRINVAALEGN